MFQDCVHLPPSQAKPPVSSVRICRAFEKTRIYVEKIPGMVRDIKGETLSQISQRRGTINDSCRGQTLHRTVIDAQNVGFRLLRDVKAEDLLFVFGQTEKALLYAQIEFPFPPPTLTPFCQFEDGCHQKQCQRNNEYDAKPRAIVLCKIIKTETFQGAFWDKKKKGSHQAQRYEITWPPASGTQGFAGRENLACF